MKLTIPYALIRPYCQNHGKILRSTKCIPIYHDLPFVFFLISFVLLFTGCEKNSTSLTTHGILLSEEFAGVTDVILNVQTNNMDLPVDYRLLRDGSPVLQGPLNDPTTTLTDDSLLPAHSYHYQLRIYKNGAFSALSNELSITTMDTTSHEFTWELNSFGIYPSTLFDVAIIDEDDIWAVGEIYSDSSQPGVLYNAVHWDRQQWELKRIQTNSVVGIGYYPINTVFAFDSDNIWMFSDAGSYSHWNGANWQTQYVAERQGGINQIWGSSPTDLYFVGTNGNITHYNGTNWQKLESGTEVDLLDVWGSTDGSVVWACGYKDFVGTVVLKITGDRVEKVYDDNDFWYIIRQDSLSGVLTSVWTDREDILYLVSPNGMYRATANTRGEARRFALNGGYFPGFPRCLRGRAINDIFAVGDFSFIGHFNGYEWHHYTEFQGRIRFRSIALIDDLGVFVGTDISSGEAIILTAR